MKRTLLVITILIALDQVTKWLARGLFQTSRGGLFDFHVTENTGVAFSVPFPSVFLVILTLVVLIFLGWMIWTQKFSPVEMVSATFVFAGALGNLIDRIFFQAVTDFIRMGNFPIFNFADIFITAGVGIFLWYEWKKKSISND